MLLSYRTLRWLLIAGLVGASMARALAGESPAAARPATDSKQPGDEQFIRIARDAQGTPVALEVAIVRYRPARRTKGGLTVDLVGAVHVAEKQYYDKLNKLFRKYEVVLYELVAPEGARVARGGEPRSGNPVSGLQRLMKQMLELEFQLEQIDYTRPNMVHADMSPEEFARSMRERGESFTAMFLRMWGYSMARQGSPGAASDADLLAALFSPNRALALKRVMAEQFVDLGGVTRAMEGSKGSTLIGQRNQVALDELKRQIEAGKKRIAIFYGAGHMIDMDRRLREQFQLEPVGRRWLVAWNMKPKVSSKRKEEPEDD